jgi:tetratricopeptide (TPR) repeat protein
MSTCGIVAGASCEAGGRARRAPLLLLAAGLLALFAAGAVAGQSPSPAPAKPRLGVLPFFGTAETLPQEYGAVPRQAIHAALEQLRAVRAVESDEIVAALARQGLSLATPPGDDALIRLARELRVRGLIAGTYAVEGDTVRIQARLVDPAGPGRIIEGEGIAGAAGEYLAAPRRIAATAMQQFQIRLSEQDERRLEAAFVPGTASLEAYALYARGSWELGLATKDAFERAAALLAKAVEADQNFARAHLELGIALYRTGTSGAPSNRWRASQEYRKAIQLDSKLAEAHKLLADMLVASPRRLYDQAVQSYQAAIEIWPDYAEARVGLGDARQAKGQYDEAIEEYKKALAIEPENARVHLGMGKIYYNEKQLYHEAVAAYQQAITLDPKLLDAHLSLGELYEEKGLYQEAVARYSHVLSVDPRHPGAMYGLALAYEKVDVKKAVEQWERYIELASQLPSEKDWVDIAKRHLGKLQRGEKPN